MELFKKLIPILTCFLLLFSDHLLAEPIPIFVSIVPQKYFVERIGKQYVKVEVMVKSGESPATLNPNSKKMNLLSQAKLYFTIGVPFETVWINRIKSIHSNLKFVPLHGKLHATQKSEQDQDHSSRDNEDPHIWTSPKRVKTMAKKIKDALIKMAPQNEKFFEDNFNSFINDLNALDNEIRNTFSRGSGHRFMVFHPAWSYFAEDYGLEQVSIEKGGKKPGPRALQEIIEKGKKLGIKVIFVQKQFSLSIASKIAKMIGASVVEIDPLAEDYLNNMRRTANAISGASR